MSTACNICTSYAMDAPPEHPGEFWTRFVCISDTHSFTKFAVPPGDVLIHAGDLSSWGSLKHLRVTLDWLCTLPHELKIIVAGNHDLCLDSKWKNEGNGGLSPMEVDAARALVRSKSMREAGIVYLDHESTEIVTSKGTSWKAYGSPAAPFHIQGAFQYVSVVEAKEEWAQIPLDVEILITHTPPNGILDQTRRRKHAGCPVLARRIHELPCCRMHVFGHIHEAHGAVREDCTVAEEGKQIRPFDFVSVNAAIASSSSLPIIVDLKKLD